MAPATVIPVMVTHHATAPKISALRNCSVLAKGWVPCSMSVISVRNSVSLSGMPARSRTAQKITTPRTSATARTAQTTDETLRAVQGSILRTMRLTRRTVATGLLGVSGKVYEKETYRKRFACCRKFPATGVPSTKYQVPGTPLEERLLALAVLLDERGGSQLVAVTHVDHLDARGVPSLPADRADGGPDADTCGGHQEDLVLGGDRQGGNQPAAHPGQLDGLDTHAAPALLAELGHGGALAIATRGEQQHLVALNVGDRCDHLVAFTQLDAPDPLRAPAHAAEILLAEPDAHAVTGEDQDVVLTVGRADRHQLVVLGEPHGHQGLVPGFVLLELGLLRLTLPGDHDQVAAGLVVPGVDHGLDDFLGTEREDCLGEDALG